MDKGDAVHIHSGILLSHEKDKIMRFAATWMQLEIIILSEVSQREMPYDITYMWNLNYGTNEPISETKTFTDIENRLMVAKGAGKLGEGCIRSLGLADANYYI